jgi:3-oxoacyl-[acyl-carrier protein] reductase
MELGLKGKVALVAAASRGLGRASARALAREGARLVVCSRSRERIEEAAREIVAASGVEVVPVQADVRSYEDIRRFVATARDRFGRVDILVTNAGGPRPGRFADMSDEDWWEAWNLTFMSVVRLVREALPLMPEGGSIINIVSTSVKQPIENLVLSNTVRPAVIGLAKSLSLELAPRGIRVNNVLPGAFLTDRMRELMGGEAEREGVSFEEVVARRARTVPLGRVGQPEELGDLVAFLASERASYITGVSIQIDGGIVRFIL